MEEEKIEKKDKKETFMSGVVILLFSQIIVKLGGLVYKIYLTNREGFGDLGNSIYNSGYHIYALLLLISSIGIPNAISKLVSEKTSIGDYKGAYRIFKVALIILSIIGMAGTLILFFGADFIANKLISIPDAKLTLMTLAPSIVLVAISSVIRGYFNGRNKMKATANSQALEQILKTIFTVIIVEIVAHVTSNDVVLMAAGATLATTVSVIGSLFYICMFYRKRRKEIHEELENAEDFEREDTKTLVKRILKISIPASLTSIVTSINKNIDSFTVVRGLKKITSAEEAQSLYGILSGKIDTLTALPLGFTIPFATALVPGISATKDDKESVNRKIRVSLLSSFLIGLPCALGLCVFAQPILNLVFPNAASGASILKVMAFVVIFTTLAQTITGCLQGLGDYKTPVIALAAGVVVKTVLNLVLIPIEGIGIYGAVVSSIICHFISFFVSFLKLKKITKIKFEVDKFVIKPIIAGVTMSILSYGIYYVLTLVINAKIATVIGIIAAVLVYAICVLLLKIFSEEEIKDIPKGEKIYNLLVKLKIY